MGMIPQCDRRSAPCGARSGGGPACVPDLLGLLEDGPALLHLPDVEEVRVQLLVLVVHLEKGAAVGVHQVLGINLRTDDKAAKPTRKASISCQKYILSSAIVIQYSKKHIIISMNAEKVEVETQL